MSFISIRVVAASGLSQVSCEIIIWKTGLCKKVVPRAEVTLTPCSEVTLPTPLAL